MNPQFRISPIIWIWLRDLSFATLVSVAFGVEALGTPTAISAQTPGADDPTLRIVDGRDLPVREHVLENGMRFLLLPRAAAPTVSFVTHVPVGSVNESLGNTGTSHILEHLLFKGTTTIGTRNLEAERALFERMDAAHDSLIQARGTGWGLDERDIGRLEARIAVTEDSARAYVDPNEFDRILALNGARGLNASTSYEATQYFVSLPSNRAKLWFVTEADRMRNPVFREFFAERDVVMEERRTRTDSSPSGLLYAAHLATAFQVHPYGVPPVGHVEDILTASRGEVEEYHERYYGPERTTVAIVGQFDPDSAIAWAERYFSPLQAGGRVPPVLVREPEQVGERRVDVRFDAEPQIRIGWKIPSALDPSAPALAILASVLVGGTDARLHRRLVRNDRIASSVFAGTGPGSLYPGLFTIQATPLAPNTAEDVEAAIYDELDRLRVEPPTSDEIGRVQTRLEAESVRRLRSSEGLAFQLVSSFAQWGDWRETFRFQERMQEVSPDDVLDVLNRYFRADTRTVAVLRRAQGS